MLPAKVVFQLFWPTVKATAAEDVFTSVRVPEVPCRPPNVAAVAWRT